MRITSLTIANFKSFGPDPTLIVFSGKLSCFIGANSSGKTTALEALKKVIGNYSERQLLREDFHLPLDSDTEAKQVDMSIELTIEFADTDEAIPVYFQDMVVDEPQGTPYLRLRLEASWRPSGLSQQGEIDDSLYVISVAMGEKETNDNKKFYPKHLRPLIQLMYVPAIRRPTDQIRYASGTILHRVLTNIDYDAAFKTEFEALIGEVNGLFSGVKQFATIQQSVQDFWTRFHKDERYKESNLAFGSSDLESVLKKLEINFTPTGIQRGFRVDELGDGYRSLFYLTLVCSLLDIEEKIKTSGPIISLERPLLTVLAIEEPENHIAPQLLGRVIRILNDISKKQNTQVILTSHTPAIVKRVDPESIIHFRICEEDCTEVSAITLPDSASEAYKYVKEAVQNYPEIYFARLVLIGEGDSEEVIFNHLKKVKGKDFDDHFISFAPLGHRFVHHIWKLLEALQTPYITLLDLDLEREGGGWGRIKYVLQQLLARGVPKKRLLLLKGDAILSDDHLNAMHTWDGSKIASLNSWLSRLRQYDVFFSYPLDIDFLMLKSYANFYTKASAFPDGSGPRIPKKLAGTTKYDEYVRAAVHATLKSETAEGKTYSDEEKDLMIWYKYHFLGRGKPVTHLQVLTNVPGKDFLGKCPEVFKAIFERIDKLLNPML